MPRIFVEDSKCPRIKLFSSNLATKLKLESGALKCRKFILKLKYRKNWISKV